MGNNAFWMKLKLQIRVSSIQYIYIVIHREKVSLQLFRMAKHVGRQNWERNPPNFTLDFVSDRSANKCTCVATTAAAAAFIC